MLRLLAFLCLLVCLPQAWSKDLLPEDFATGQRIYTVGHAPFYRLRLPETVYTGVANEDLRDVRIFNNRGEPVPFALLAEPTVQPTAQISVELRAFSLPESEQAPDGDEDGLVTYDDGRMQLRWSRNAAQARPQLLLVAPDAEGSIGATLSALQLSWAESPVSWQQTATLESSDDLSEWTVIASKQPLMDLRENGQRLKVGRIDFPTTRARYWRLTLSHGKAPALSKVEGVHQSQTPDPDLVWLKPTLVDSPGTYQRTYRFPAVVTAETVRIALPQPNSVVPLTLEYRDNADAAWQPLLRTIAWRLNPDKTTAQAEQVSPPVPVSMTRILEIRLSAGPSGWGTGEPTLELGRSALFMLFNARGASPFLLAWGSAAAQHAALDAQRLIPGYSDAAFFGLPEARAAEAIPLGGERRRFEAGLADRQARWRSRLLWMILLAGTAGLAVLAWHLWKEFQDEPVPDKPED